MEVILLEKMRNLGVLGDTVKVKPGFARNYLIPQGKAVYATKANIAKFEQRRSELETREVEKNQHAVDRQKAIETLGALMIGAKASDEGKLFGSITTRDIAASLSDAGVSVEKREIQLPEGALRRTGEYEILVDLGGDVTAILKVNVFPEG